MRAIRMGRYGQLRLLFGAALLIAATVPASAPTAESLSSRRIVMVAATTGPPKNDRPMLARLQATGLTVEIVDDDALTAAVVAGLHDAAGVVVSTSVKPIAVGTRLTSIAAPILTWEPGLYDELLVSAGPSGESASSREIMVIDPLHPISAGLAGTVAVLGTG